MDYKLISEYTFNAVSPIFPSLEIQASLSSSHPIQISASKVPIFTLSLTTKPPPSSKIDIYRKMMVMLSFAGAVANGLLRS